MNIVNQIWDFFASVRLAIFTLIALATTSIAGTIIPQNESPAFYVENFGPKTAQFFQILDLHHMYYSWWFLGLLGLLSANLVVCSIERFPAVWKIIHADNFATDQQRLLKMRDSKTYVAGQNSKINTAGIVPAFKKLGWSLKTQETADGTLCFAQKSRWSRVGVYIVHVSILVIFGGALIGHFTGFKGSIMLPELKRSAVAYAFADSSPFPFGFDVRCDYFNIEFYDNGMPKEYTSKLTILENEKEILSKIIEVNDPLTYKGITFYQSSYQGYQNFIVSIRNKQSNQSEVRPVPFQKQNVWDAENIRFGVINAEVIGQRVTRLKLWVKAGEQPAVIKWLAENETLDLPGESGNFEISAKQMYATGLQVAKDPGVWVVYIGCALMLIGLFMAFFLSHKRIWIYLQTAADKRIETILIAGVTNKNKPAFAKEFGRMKKTVEDLVN